MRIKNPYKFISVLFILLFLIIMISCSYISPVKDNLHNIKDKFYNIVYEINNFFKFIGIKFNGLLLRFNNLLFKIKRFIINDIVLIKNLKISKQDSKLSEKIISLKNFGKKYDEMISDTMLLYSSSGVPVDKDLIISIYVYYNQSNIDFTKFQKYHFKLVELSKENYEKSINKDLIEIKNNISTNINSSKKDNKKNTGKLLYVKKYRLTLKNSKPAIFAQFIDSEEKTYYGLIENLPADLSIFPEDYKIYPKKYFPKIRYYTFYYYPLSTSYYEIAIGFYEPINPIRFFAFFAIIFIVVIILLIFGYILLKHYLFNEDKYENINFKKVENIEKMNHNKDEKEKEFANEKFKRNIEFNEKRDYDEKILNEKNINKDSEESIKIKEKQGGEKTKEDRIGEEVNISDIPDFDDFT